MLNNIDSKDAFDISLEDYVIRIRTGINDNSRYKWIVNGHNNAEYELHIIIQGKCNVGLGNNIRQLVQGDYIIISPNYYHSANSITNEFEHFYLSFTFKKNDLLKDKIDEIIHKEYATGKFNITIEQLCHRYYIECFKNSIFSDDNKKAIITQIFIEILRILDISLSKQIEKKYEIDPRDIIDQYFEQFYIFNSNQSFLAKELCISTRQLSRYLLNNYGITYREKLLSTKIEYAKWLLINSNLNIEKISKSIGYSSESSFFNMFKKRCGISPQKFRSMNRGKNL